MMHIEFDVSVVINAIFHIVCAWVFIAGTLAILDLFGVIG
jgi:hypothetical protein